VSLMKAGELARTHTSPAPPARPLADQAHTRATTTCALRIAFSLQRILSTHHSSLQHLPIVSGLQFQLTNTDKRGRM
jgi:hypothetical protein